jgi:thioredoxin 1
MSEVTEVTDATFGERVLAAERAVLVDFWAPWCAPCRLVAPIVDLLAAEFAGRLDVARLDIDENIATATRYAIFSIPTLVVFKGGEEVERIVGFRPLEALSATVRPHL